MPAAADEALAVPPRGDCNQHDVPPQRGHEAQHSGAHAFTATHALRCAALCLFCLPSPTLLPPHACTPSLFALRSPLSALLQWGAWSGGGLALVRSAGGASFQYVGAARAYRHSAGREAARSQRSARWGGGAGQRANRNPNAAIPNAAAARNARFSVCSGYRARYVSAAAADRKSHGSSSSAAAGGIYATQGAAPNSALRDR